MQEPVLAEAFGCSRFENMLCLVTRHDRNEDQCALLLVKGLHGALVIDSS